MEDKQKCSVLNGIVNHMYDMDDSYYVIEENSALYNTDDSSLDGTEDALTDEDWDAVRELCRKNPTLEKAVGTGFKAEDIWQVKDYVDALYSGKVVKVFENNGEEVGSFSLADLYNHLLKRLLDAENLEIEVCALWCGQLQNFIDRGMWHVAMRSVEGVLLENPDDWPFVMKETDGRVVWRKEEIEYAPVMWYGIPDAPLIPEWTIGNEGIKALVPIEDGLGDYGGQLRIRGLEINYMDLFEGFCDWYFGSCANEGVDFSKVIDTCPIDLVEVYKNKNGMKLLAAACAHRQDTSGWEAKQSHCSCW